MTYYRGIALVGKARSGKDTVAKRLIQRFAYTRVAFADPLRMMALDVDPIVCAQSHYRLKAIVEDIGWDRAKEDYPEIRRILQNIGQTVRDLDPKFWLRQGLDKIEVADRWNLPVVVTDVRYRNEVRALVNRDFLTVRILRDGAGLSGDSGKHDSETELDGFECDRVISNDGTVAELNTIVDTLVMPRA
ncbi:hypothetical protein OH828_14480 [Streptomyces anulatus]|uniref:deoxynucleotide monophosphate kinase family protein n=1 Tax=Streptomyces anulatus TaxID=1892 RepID=UPI003868B6D1